MNPPEDPDQMLKGVHSEYLPTRKIQIAAEEACHPMAWQPPSPDDLAKLLPQYEIKKMIGFGGMGAVYQGVQAILERPVAIKLMPTEFSSDPEFIARFYREARMLAKLQHPNIVTIYDFGQTPEGYLYFVMEFVNGTDLGRIISSAALTTEQALELTIQICGALHYAHSRGVIHRDIKPANVLVTADGNAKLADFGLARPVKDEAGMVTRTNVVMGTPAYMAPEQREGHADERADIYALGVMLYEMLTGKRPRGVFEPPSMKVQVDVRLDQVVIKAMQQEPERRYQHVSELRTEVERIRSTPLEGSAAANPVVSTDSKLAGRTKSAQPNLPMWIAVFAALLISINGLLIWSGIGTRALTVRESEPQVPPSFATKDKPFENSLGMKFVPVPITGGTTAGKKVLFSIWDTRTLDYEVFAGETKREWQKPGSDQNPMEPAVNVSWDDAKAFCNWLTKREQLSGKLPANMEYRLPGDHEWSCAVGIGEREEPNIDPQKKSGVIGDHFPWGGSWPPQAKVGNYADSELKKQRLNPPGYINGYNDGFGLRSPVGSFAANTFGIYDLGGDVWQWCEDWHNTNHRDRVMRGASYLDGTREVLLSSYRREHEPGSRFDSAGFRCVIDTALKAASPTNTSKPGNPEPPTAPPDITSGLVSWWRAEGDARDAVGGNHGSSLNGASFGPGKHGQAFLFNTPGAYVSIPASAMPAFGGNRFTLALWAKFGAAGGEGSFLASQGTDRHDIWAFCNVSNRLQFHVLGDAGVRLGSAEFAPEAGVWHHLAVVRSGYIYRIYIDGAAASSESWPGKISETAAAVTLGKTEQGSFDGLLDDVRVYNRALSATDIKALFEAP